MFAYVYVWSVECMFMCVYLTIFLCLYKLFYVYVGEYGCMFMFVYLTVCLCLFI